MHDTSNTVSLATRADIEGLLALQEENQLDNGGSLSARFAREWFETAIDRQQVIVARKGGPREGKAVTGYLVFTEFAAQAHVPIIQAMMKAYAASPNAYNYGPICVASSERGRGLAGAMFDLLRKLLPVREAVAFIRANNAASRGAHRKMGFREAAIFNQGGVDFVVVAHGGA